MYIMLDLFVHWDIITVKMKISTIQIRHKA